MSLLLLLACAHVLPPLEYDPTAPPRATPLVGPASLEVAGWSPLGLRNAGPSALTVYAVEVVPARAARVRAPRLPARLEPGATLALEVEGRQAGELLVRTSAGVRLVGITSGGTAPPLTGVVDRGEVSTAIAPYLVELSGCYTASLARHRGLTGRVRARVEVDGTGAVTEVKVVDTTLPAGRVEACLVDALAGVALPADGRRRAFVYPFVFTPR